MGLKHSLKSVRRVLARSVRRQVATDGRREARIGRLAGQDGFQREAQIAATRCGAGAARLNRTVINAAAVTAIPGQRKKTTACARIGKSRMRSTPAGFTGSAVTMIPVASSSSTPRKSSVPGQARAGYWGISAASAGRSTCSMTGAIPSNAQTK